MLFLNGWNNGVALYANHGATHNATEYKIQKCKKGMIFEVEKWLFHIDMI